MPPIPLKSKPDEKDVELLDYSGAINQLVTIAKKELEDIKGNILQSNVQLSQLKDKIIKDTNELERWKSSEKQKFNNEINQVKNDIIQKQNSINLHLQQQEKITIDLQTQMKRFEGLKSEQIKFKEDLIKLEGKKIEILDSIKQSESIKSDALFQRNQVAMTMQEALNIQEKNKQENIRLVNLNDSLESRAKKIDEDTKALSTLREFVEPKLRAIKEEQDFLDKAKKENQERIDELNRKMSEEKILLQSVLDKKSEYEKEYKKFLSDKEEFSRQQLLSGK